MPDIHPAHAAAYKAREALERCRGEAWLAGTTRSYDTDRADRAAREVTAAIATLVKLATGVESQQAGDWAEERTA